MTRDAPDAVVVGSGPNGLAAAITLAQAGRSVVVYEGAETIGGGMRSAELTLPGIVHDVCSTIQGTSLASPFFRALDLPSLGVELLHPGAPVAHPLDDGRVAMLERSVAATATGLGIDADRYRHLMAPLVRDADKLMPFVLGPFDPFPRHPLAAARFGFAALRSAKSLAGSFHDELAPALMTGLSGHAMVPLGQPLTSAFGLVLGISAHAYGWPVVRGGTQVMADAMAARLRSLGGEIVTGRPDRLARRAARGPGDPLRHHAARPGRHRRRPAARSLSATHRGLPLRGRHLQARLGPGRPDPVADRVGRARWDRPPGWHLARGRGGRGRRDAPSASGPTVRHPRPGIARPTPREPHRAVRRVGRTAMCPTARRST